MVVFYYDSSHLGLKNTSLLQLVFLNLLQLLQLLLMLKEQSLLQTQLSALGCEWRLLLSHLWLSRRAGVLRSEGQRGLQR